MLLFLVWFNQFQIYGVTYSYSSCPFLCALGCIYTDENILCLTVYSGLCLNWVNCLYLCLIPRPHLSPPTWPGYEANLCSSLIPRPRLSPPTWPGYEANLCSSPIPRPRLSPPTWPGYEANLCSSLIPRPRLSLPTWPGYEANLCLCSLYR